MVRRFFFPVKTLQLILDLFNTIFMIGLFTAIYFINEIPIHSLAMSQIAPGLSIYVMFLT